MYKYARKMKIFLICKLNDITSTTAYKMSKTVTILELHPITVATPFIMENTKFNNAVYIKQFLTFECFRQSAVDCIITN